MLQLLHADILRLFRQKGRCRNGLAAGVLELLVTAVVGG